MCQAYFYFLRQWDHFQNGTISYSIVFDCVCIPKVLSFVTKPKLMIFAPYLIQDMKKLCTYTSYRLIRLDTHRKRAILQQEKNVVLIIFNNINKIDTLSCCHRRFMIRYIKMKQIIVIVLFYHNFIIYSNLVFNQL